jgi:pilus assembly protein CpaB
MNRTQIVVLGVSVAAFGAAFLLFNSWQSPQAPAVVQSAPKVDLDQVLVASEDIPMGSVVAENSVNWQPWPKAAVSEQMIAKSTGPNELEDVKGSMTRLSFMRGEPIRRDKLVKAGQGGFMSAILPTGKRAVAIKIDGSGESTAGGFILPNDRVDLVQVFRDEEATRARGAEVLTTRTILANVKVLAIGQILQDDNGKKVAIGSNATLELSPEQAELVVLSQQNGGGNLHLLLRSLVDSGGEARTVSGNEAKGRGGLTIMRFGSAQEAAR